ncbi:MAG TPA: SDR family oxidoreductase [Pirellulales bacterium]|jgi:3-oxoacyl-[acyl-carrier protein] reductase|nr:SDR family oxidoreductase [Pirellulales bacterium]
MGSVAGKSALVTGGARGIGAAIVEELSAHGANVLAPTRQELDLADPSAPARYVQSSCPGGVDILVNNAGINFIRPLAEVDCELWSQTMQVNLHAPFQLLQLLAPKMAARRWGRVVNISSVFSLVTKEKRAIYSATKSGLNGLTRTAAVEFGPAGVLINAVCPGFVETELTRQNNSPADIECLAASVPLRRLAKPAEIARFVRFLCSEDNTYINGQSLVIDGGFTLQ